MNAIEPMTSAEAAAYAPTWGSYMTGGDPGACMYGFSGGDGRPQDEDHRQAVIRYMTKNLEQVKADPDAYNGEPDDEDDEPAQTADDVIEDIERFLAWMRTCETKDAADGDDAGDGDDDAGPPVINRGTEFRDSNLNIITYGQVLDAIEATDSDPYRMTIKNDVEWAAIAQCVNQGIDSHLEAITDAQQEFDNGVCRVSPANLCVLLRRLSETAYRDDYRFEDRLRNADLGENATTADLLYDAGYSLQAAILQVLGFDEYGKFVGRDV